MRWLSARPRFDQRGLNVVSFEASADRKSRRLGPLDPYSRRANLFNQRPGSLYSILDDFKSSFECSQGDTERTARCLAPTSTLGNFLPQPRFLTTSFCPRSPIDGSLLTFNQALEDTGIEALGNSRAGRVHPGIRVDLDQPDGKVLHHHEISPVQLEAASPPVHLFLGGQHRQNYSF